MKENTLLRDQSPGAESDIRKEDIIVRYLFNKSISSIPASASLAINEKAKAMRAAGKDVITLAAGEPDFDTPDRARIAGIRAISEGHTHYTESRGIRPLREGIARMLREDRGIACTADNILMAPGGKYAIYETVRTLIDPGEGQEVMILNPGWVSYAPIVSAAGGVPVGVELTFEENYHITRLALEKVVSPRTRLLIMNYPNNPTGCVLSREEAECIADFALDHEMLILSDEVYSTIVYDGAESVSPASIARVADHVITVNGFSKCAAMTGWRLGYICAPREIVDMVQMLNQHTMSCLSEFAMEAALETLQCKDETAAMVESYRHRRDFFVAGLNAIPGVTCYVPKGTFYAWAKIELDGKNSQEIADFLLEEAGVATVPGDAYGLGGTCCIRMSFATAEDDLRKALRRMDAAIRKINR